MTGPAGPLTLPPPSLIDIAGTHTIEVADGPDQWLTATADCVLSIAEPVDAWVWTVTVTIIPGAFTVTLPDSSSPVPVRWDGGGIKPDPPAGECLYVFKYWPTLDWHARVGGRGMSAA